MRKIAVFDFCETISTFQTLDPFLIFVLEHEFPQKAKILQNKMLIKVINYLTYVICKFIPNLYIYKLLLVYATKGVKESSLWEYGQVYYRNYIKPNLVSASIELMNRFRDEGYENLISSGGSKYYITFFAKEYGINSIYTAEIGIKNGVSTGKLINDCLGKNKLIALEEIKSRGLENISFEYAISDSVSDMPLLSFCKNQIVISRRRHQEWVTSEMEEIIWDL